MLLCGGVASSRECFFAGALLRREGVSSRRSCELCKNTRLSYEMAVQARIEQPVSSISDTTD